ncbi:MAG: lytic transglycosylase domain-containing protein [Deltaproteobacteria bacterium]|nr:lytic transglycosylase domain-containing protein [Deltaproteobacteria bacterium]
MKLNKMMSSERFGALGGLAWTVPALCFLLALFAVTSMPTAHDDSSLRLSSSGAQDIVLLSGPQEVEGLVENFDPDRCLNEIRDRKQIDGVRQVLARVAYRMDPEKRNVLARHLVDEGKRTGIDPLFLAAVIRVESAFSPSAVSNRGARGLMQVMPMTGEELAQRMGMDWRGPQQLHDPETNVRLGVTYLRRLLDYYHGNYKFALTAYNRGPGSVRHIVARHGNLSFEYTGYFRKIQSIYKGYLREVGAPVATL